MSTRNLFLKSSASQKWWRLFFVLLGVFGVVIIMMYPKERKLDDGVWQSPIEPPGVTIVSHEAQTLIVPASTTSDAARQERVTSDVVQFHPGFADAVVNPAEISANDHAQIRKALERWSLAWSSRNIDAYFNQYARSFVPAGGQSRSVWERTRRQRILSKSQIVHEIRDLQITLDGNKATANFEQMYATDQTRLVGPKTLRLQKEGLDWLIISESSN